MPALISRDRRRDVAAIERIVRGLKPGLSSGRRAFSVHHELQGSSEVFLFEDRANGGNVAIGQEYLRGRRMPRDLVLFGGDDLVEERIDGKAIARGTNRRGGDITEGHRAPAAQRLYPVRRGRGNDGVQQAIGDRAAVLVVEHGDVGRGRPWSDTVDDPDRSIHEANHDRRDPAEADKLRFQYVDREAGRHAGVDRVAACLQDLESGEGRVIMTGHDDMIPRDDIWPARAAGSEQA